MIGWGIEQCGRGTLRQTRRRCFPQIRGIKLALFLFNATEILLDSNPFNVPSRQTHAQFGELRPLKPKIG